MQTVNIYHARSFSNVVYFQVLDVEFVGERTPIFSYCKITTTPLYNEPKPLAEFRPCVCSYQWSKWTYLRLLLFNSVVILRAAKNRGK